jgi:hypothetical protein
LDRGTALDRMWLLLCGPMVTIENPEEVAL